MNRIESLSPDKRARLDDWLERAIFLNPPYSILSDGNAFLYFLEMDVEVNRG